MSIKSTTENIVRFDVPDIAIRALTNPKFVIGLSILLPIIIVSILGEAIIPHDPLETNVAEKYAGPGGKYLLGTDHLGRDLLSRVIMGGRTSLLLGFAATALSLTAGIPIGLFAGYKKGRTDEILMRLMDIIMSIPGLLLGILVLVVLGPDTKNVILAVGVIFTPRIARVVRSAVLSVSEEAYVKAAIARGESTTYILGREILPNVTAPIVVEGSIRIGYAILVGTGLSFLGLGSGPPHPDWGYMIAVARMHIYATPWFLIWPGLALVLTITSTNLLGDGLRDILDPQMESDR